jgi:hypothetical protein
MNRVKMAVLAKRYFLIIFCVTLKRSALVTQKQDIRFSKAGLLLRKSHPKGPTLLSGTICGESQLWQTGIW